MAEGQEAGELSTGKGGLFPGTQRGDVAGRAFCSSGNCKWDSVVRIVGALEPQGKWVLGRGRRGGHHPYFIESKIRLREVCLLPSE